MKAILSLLLATTPAAAAEQFDLICHGTMSMAWGKAEPGRYIKQEPSTATIHVDLQKQEWCSNDCTTIAKFAEVTSGMLTFVKEGRVQEDVNRLTGEWRRRKYTPGANGGIITKTNGKCEPGPFSGIPSSEKKF